MFTADVLLLVLLLLTAGGWFSKSLSQRQRVIVPIACAALIALSFVPTLYEGRVSAYLAADALLLLLLLTQRVKRPILCLLCALLAGTVGWKLVDLFPLFWEHGLLLILPTLLLCGLLLKRAEDARFAVALSPYVSGACVALSDQFLFRYSVFPIGTEAGFCATVIGLLCVQLWTEYGAALKRKLSSKRKRRALPAKENPEF